MSSNNQLVILKKKGKFEIHENFCIDNEFKSSNKTLLKKEDTLIKAIRFAKKYCNEYPYVEYGYIIMESALK